jgi:hypothetical protein
VQDGATGTPDAVHAHCQTRIGSMVQDKWRLDALVGIGGMAAVYAATHRNGAVSAIKILHPAFAANRDIKTRFLREAYIANKVSHTGAIKVLDDDITEDGCPFLVMELLIGESLENRMQRAGGVLPPGQVLQLAEELLDIMSSAHASGIVHRDLKPDNVFITKDGKLKVLDFGIARLREATGDGQQTRTGVLMGTPAYMSPEQALGRQSEIGPHSDVFSIGALMFKLLTGEHVHEGETEGEMVISAATRPARSLARVLPGAPVELVSIVDRALSYEWASRYPNCQEFRENVGALTERLSQQEGAPAGAQQAPGAAPQAQPSQEAAPAGLSPEQARALAQRQVEFDRMAAMEDETEELRALALTKVDGLTVFDIKEEDVVAIEELCTLVERALISRGQYGGHHPETTRKFEVAFEHAQETLLHADVGLIWNVSPYSFHIGDYTVWDPAEKFYEVPYRAFSSGIRMLAVLPGITSSEFESFLRILTLDPATEIAPEDDLVTLLWEASFPHILYLEVDSFAEGDQQARVAFDNERDEIMGYARYMDADNVQAAWMAMQRVARELDAAQKQAAMLTVLSGQRLRAEAIARASRLDVKGEASQEARMLAQSLVVDQVTRDVLEAQLNVQSANTSQRFAHVAADGFLAARAVGKVDTVLGPLAWAADGLAKAVPITAVVFVNALCAALRSNDKEKTKELRGELAAGVVTLDNLQQILVGASTPDTDVAELIRGLEKLFGNLNDTYVPSVLESLRSFEEGKVMDLLLDYVASQGHGQVALMRELLPQVAIPLGVGLVRVLVKIETPAAKEAIVAATQSPHAVVRIEALGHLEGVSSDRVRQELQALMADKDETVRMAALKSMADCTMRVGGPFLVLRIRSREFDSLSIAERKQALDTVAILAPPRAEAIALELLAKTKAFASSAHEETRELAADMLGRVVTPNNKKAIDALEKTSTLRWKNSSRVRSAALRSLTLIQQRAQLEGRPEASR